MNKKFVKLTSLIIVIIMIATTLLLSVAMALKDRSYTQSLDYSENVDNYLNPDQGFYRTAVVNVTPFGVTDKSYIIKDEFQLYHLRMDISAFSHVVNENEDIELTPTTLTQIENLINKFFERGKNVILRFAYDKNFDGLLNQEPNMSMVLKHIAQICEIANKYPYTITAIEAGLIGPWGEMHSSNMATSENISSIIDTYLNNTTNIPILVRTPKMIYDYLGITIDDINTYTIQETSKAYRLGVFNDGYLGSENDLGTYTDRIKEILWLSKQTHHLPFGGEVTRPTSPLHDIDNCLTEMNVVNLSYLNYEWNNEIVQNKWEEQIYTPNHGDEYKYYGRSAYEYIRNHMGYRFVLKNSTFTYGFKKDKLKIDLNLENVGFGNLNRKKDMSIIFVKDDVIKKVVPCGKYGGLNKIHINTKLNNLHGEYEIYIKLNNTQNNVQCYPIRFANNLWNETLQANKIGKIRI